MKNDYLRRMLYDRYYKRNDWDKNVPSYCDEYELETNGLRTGKAKVKNNNKLSVYCDIPWLRYKYELYNNKINRTRGNNCLRSTSYIFTNGKGSGKWKYLRSFVCNHANYAYV